MNFLLEYFTLEYHGIVGLLSSESTVMFGAAIDCKSCGIRLNFSVRILLEDKTLRLNFIANCSRLKNNGGIHVSISNELIGVDLIAPQINLRSIF
ncbi:hypothetical protein evm_015406 [Chilo suppressalis]|nr:hypothetical protein evm_015406 [Chilo suppressalis]